MLRRLVLLCSWRLALTSVCVAELKAPGLPLGLLVVVSMFGARAMLGRV